MSKIQFTIQGNQENPLGNPLGYKRTLNHSWRADSTRYVKWCEYVRLMFYQAYNIGGIPVIVKEKLNARDMLKQAKKLQPLTTSKTNPMRMDIEVEFANDVRPDTDNVYKGIADALFENDKYLMDGSFTSKMSPEKKGRVTVTITPI